MIELRDTEENDQPSLSELFEEGFGHSLTAEEWNWKYRQVPGRGRSAVAVDELGRVVAHAGLLGLPARDGRDEGLLWQLVDWVGTTRHTGLRPPLVALGRWFLGHLPPGSDWPQGDLPWNYGFPSPRHLSLGERILGYGRLHCFHELRGALHGSAAAPGAELPEGLRFESSDRWTGSPEGARRLWEACCPFGVRRTAAFLEWRYWARPGRYYRFYRIQNEAHLGDEAGGEGLAVFAFVGKEARAAELWLPPGAGLERALPAVARDLLESGLETWAFWPAATRVTGDGYDPLAALELAPGAEVAPGFRPRPAGSDHPPRRVRDFYFAMGDYDLT